METQNVTDTQTEVVETQEKTAEVTAAEEATAGEAKKAETVEKEPEIETPEVAEAKRNRESADFRTKSKKRIQQLEIENAYLKGLSEGKGGKTEQKQADTAEQDAEPNPDKFETHSDYVKAVSEFAAKKAVRDYEESQQRKAQAKTVEEKQEAFQKRVNEVVERGQQEFEDFDEVTHKDNLKLTPYMVDALLDAVEDTAMTHRIEYHLGKNPEQTAKIAAMPPARQIREIVALEATLKAAAAKQTTKAPPPVTDVKGGGTAQRSIAEVEDMDEYAARRKIT